MAAKSEYEFVDDISDKYRCSVCTNVLDEPVLTDCCGQHFCKKCLEGWFRKGQRQKKTCPHCRNQNFTYINYIPLKRKINDLKIYCPNHSKGCSKQFSLNTLDSHLKTCSFVNVDCSNKCGKALLRKDLKKHCQETCPNRQVKCQYCTLAGLHKDITGEHLKACPEVPLACPRNCGKREIKRRDLEAHRQVCPQEPVQCSFFEAGCKEKLTRKDLEAHTDSSSQHHLQSVMTTLSSLLNDHKRLKSQHQDLQDKFTNLVSCVSEEVGHIDQYGRGNCVSDESLMCIKTALHLSTSMLVPGAQEYWLHFKQDSENSLRTPSFYLSPGYKMYLQCSEQSQQQHGLQSLHRTESVSLILQKSNYDDSLPWPIPNELDIHVEREDRQYYQEMYKKQLCTNCNPSLNLSRIADDNTERVILTWDPMELPNDSSIYCFISLNKHQCEPKQQEHSQQMSPQNRADMIPNDW